MAHGGLAGRATLRAPRPEAAGGTPATDLRARIETRSPAVRRDERIRDTVASVVGIVDRIPVYAEGLASVVSDAGFRPEVTDDPLSWLCTSKGPLFVAVRTSRDVELLATLHRLRPEAIVIAIVSEPTAAAYGSALEAGACAAMPESASVDELLRVIDAATRGLTVLPCDVARDIATGRRLEPSPDAPVTDEEREWLQSLACGATIARLGRQHGYSERTMHRLLQRLYRRMSVGGREEALVKAARWGVISEGDAR